MDSISRSSIESKETPVIQKVSPRIIPGSLTTNNKGTIDWGCQSLVAYGCNQHVVVVDTKTLKVFQTLKKHKADVVKVKFSKENYLHDTFNPYTLCLASGDASGKIVVWDIKLGAAKKVFGEGSKPISELEWAQGSDSCQNLLLALHPQSLLILWNTELGQVVWKKHFNGEILLSFTCDPFNHANLAFLALDCILFVEDLNLQKPPKNNGRKFFVSSGNGTPSTVKAEEEKKTVSNLLTRRIGFITRAESKVSEEVVALNDCRQLSYHQSYRHHLLLQYPREILILDLEINQTVGIVTTLVPMVMFYSCHQRDALMCLHETGSVSFRVKSSNLSEDLHKGTGDYSQDSEITYESFCQSDAFRLTKNAKVTGMACCPLTETKIALLISDGKIIILDLLAQSKVEEEPKQSTFPAALYDLIPPLFITETKTLPKFKFLLTGLLSNLASPPHIIQMCPPVTYRNWKYHQPLLAIGNNQGNIQIVNMATGVMEREFSLHTAAVRGIEWIGLDTILTFAHPNVSVSGGKVGNELTLTNIYSGRTKSIRCDNNDESPIQMVRVSQLKQYFIVVFKEEPFELWDLNTLILLRTMPKNFPSITAMTWSPMHWKKTPRVESFDSQNQYPGIEEVTLRRATLTKEHLVVTDVQGQLYHLIVDGNVIKNSSRIPPEAGMGSITSIIWKSDQIVLGDADGNLNIWDIKERVSQGIATRRGWIKKIKFAPGKGNMKILILFGDGADIWDVRKVERISTCKCPGDLPRIHDIDWAGSDRPVFSTVDGCIIITDCSMKTVTSPLIDYHSSGKTSFLPALMTAKGCFNLRSTLHQAKECDLFNLQGLSKDDKHHVTTSLNNNIVHYLKQCRWKTAQRAFLVSRLFGDEEGSKFWIVALHYLLQAANKQDLSKEPLSGHAASPLDTCFDIFCDTNKYHKLQLERAYLHDAKRSSKSQTEKCAQRLLLLGQTDRAVQLYLETDATSENYYVDSLKSCLVASSNQNLSESQSVFKLVATNLIASGRICEGVELLTLINKGADGCRYLQAGNLWEFSLWLAKCTLETSDFNDVAKRYADHLIANNNKNKAALLLLSLSQFWSVIEMLQEAKMVERAGLLLQACLEMQVVLKTPKNVSAIEQIQLDYARYLLSINNCSAASELCDAIGPAADNLKKEVIILLEDSNPSDS